MFARQLAYTNYMLVLVNRLAIELLKLKGKRQ